MVPLLWPLAALAAGILCSSILDSKAVWIALPLATLISLARPKYSLLAIALLGAGLRSMHSVIPPDPGVGTVRLTGVVQKPPEWRGLGAYLDIELKTVDGNPFSGRARLAEF